jgi:hypothetical protein
MGTIRVGTDEANWVSAVPFFGPNAVYRGKDIIKLKVLSDRRKDGGGIAWIMRVEPPPGKMVKIVAVALSEEHVFNLEGGRTTKSGQPAQSGDYNLNPTGQPHSAMLARETEALVIYSGEPDEIRSLEVVDVEGAG